MKRSKNEIGESQPNWLPLHGTVCEYSLGGSTVWNKCTIKATCKGQGAIIYCEPAEFGECYVSFYGNDKVQFRPIRDTRREIVDSIVSCIVDYYENPKGAERYRGLSERIFESMRDGKIKGCSITRC